MIFLFLWSHIKLLIKVKENFDLLHNNMIQYKAITVVLRNRVFWLCIILNHRRRMTCKNFQNFTKFFMTIVRLYSVGSLGLIFVTLPRAVTGRPFGPLWFVAGESQLYINRDFLSWPEPLHLRMWDDTLRTLNHYFNLDPESLCKSVKRIVYSRKEMLLLMGEGLVAISIDCADKYTRNATWRPLNNNSLYYKIY